MKKILYIFIILSNLILFSFLHSVYQEKDISDAYNLYGYKDGKVQFTVVFKNEMKDKYNQEFIEFIHTLSTTYNVTIVNEISSYNKGIRYYISSPKSFQDITGINDKTPISFFSNTDAFYTNKNNSDHNFYTIKKNFFIELHPFAQVINDEIPNGNFTVLSDTQQIADDIKYELQEKYGNYIEEVVEMQQDALNVEESVRDKLQIVYIMSCVIIVMLLLLILESNFYKIGIMKLHGYSSIAIFKKVFLGSFFWSIGLCILTCIVLFALRIGTINSITISFIKELCKALCIEIIVILFIMCIMVIICTFISSAQLLKKQNQLKAMLSFNYILKITCVIFTMPIFMSHWTVFLEQYEQYKLYERNEKELSSYSWFSNLKSGYQNDGYNLSNYMMNIFDDTYERYQNDYEQINKNGALYYSVNDIAISSNKMIPCVLINENYLQTLSLKDMQGKRIKVKAKPYSMLIIPEEYKQLDIMPFILNDGNEMESVIIKDNQAYTDLSLLRGVQTGKNPIFLVYSDTARRISKSIFNDVYYKGNIDNIKEKVSVKNIVEIAYGRNEIKDIQEYRIPLMKDHVIVFILMLLMMIALSIEYVFFYFKIYAKPIKIKRLHGYSIVSIYKYILILCTSVYLPSLLIMMKNHEVNIAIFVIILIDILIHSGFIYMYHNKQSLLNGKGDFV